MSAREIPASRYTSPEQLALEIDRVFGAAWLLAAHSSEIATPGSFSVFEIAGDSLLIVRGDDGVARAFFNVCRHRGTLLCTEAHGSARSFRCVYHHWEYARDGKLMHAPGAGASAVDADLRPAHAVERFGFVWVSMADHPLDIDEYLAPVATELGWYNPEQYRLETENVIAVAANWKASSDVNNESYHVATLHPELLEVASGETFELRGDHSVQSLAIGHPTRDIVADERVTTPLLELLSAMGVEGFPASGRIADVRPAIARAFRERARDVGVAFPDLDDEKLARKQQVHVFPNVQLNFTPFRLELYRHRPHATDPSRCWFDELSFGRPGNRPERAPERRRFRHGERDLGPVMGADVDILPRLQAGMLSRGCKTIRVGQGEECIAHMHDVLERWIARAGGA